MNQRPYLLDAATFLQQRQHNPPPMVIDLRDPRDFAQGHLAAARSIPWTLLPEEALFFSPGRRYLFYSNAENQGLSESIDLLAAQGFNNLGAYFGGYQELSRQLEQSKDSILLARLPREDWLAEIERVLDERLRPHLDADGGGIQLVSLEGDKLFVDFTGNCKNCDSSRTATLRLVQVSLSVLLNHDLKVIARRLDA
ncbi:MAG: NifU family protein [bacterium]|nr:NifU family protein [bacterium]